MVGGNSFSGAHFAASMMEQGHEVLSISRSERTSHIFLPEYWMYEEKFCVPFTQVDLNKDIEELNDLVSSYRPDLVVNFAAQGMVAQSWERPIDWYKTNILAQIELHEVLRQYGGLKRYVHVTTPEVYGSTQGWIEESRLFNPSTPYAASRAACDMHLYTYFKGHNFPVVFTRAANVYGPGQQLYRIIPRAMVAALTGKKLKLHGGGKSKRSFIHITDVVKATYAVAMDGQLGECYHISTNEIRTVAEVVDAVAKIFEMDSEDICTIGPERLGKDYEYMLDSTKIRSKLAWNDEINFVDGLMQVKTWMENNLKEIENMTLDYQHKV